MNVKYQQDPFFYKQFSYFCEQGGDGDANSGQLGLANLGGVFIVLMGGVILSCLLAVAEFMWEARKIVKDKEVRYHKHPLPGVGKTVQSVCNFYIITNCFITLIVAICLERIRN